MIATEVEVIQNWIRRLLVPMLKCKIDRQTQRCNLEMFSHMPVISASTW